MEERHCFFIDMFNNLMDSNLSKVSADAKANPEFIKQNRREMLYCICNHICVHGSDYHFAKSLSCTMRNVEQNARICLLMGTWYHVPMRRSDARPCRNSMHEWGYIASPLCDCGEHQTMKHIVNECPLTCFDGVISELHQAHDAAFTRLLRQNLRS